MHSSVPELARAMHSMPPMPVREIPRSEWKSFFRSFSRVHDGWLCTLEVAAPALGAAVETIERPFAGIDVEGVAGDARVQIFIGGRPDGHEAHEVAGATGVWLEELDDVQAGVRIEGPGTMARLFFRSPMRPEEVDDIA
jgi:hypothetical protein